MPPISGSISSRVDVVANLWKIVTGLQVQQVEAFDAAQAAKTESAAAHAEAVAARAEVGQVRLLVGRLVRPIVDWLDAGAKPPPPEVPPELRALLADVEHEHPAQD